MKENTEWKEVRLGDIIYNVSEKFNFLKYPDYIFLNTSDVLEGKILESEEFKNKGKKLPGQAKKALKNNDILFSEIRPINKRFALILKDAEKYIVSTKFMILRAKNRDFIDIKFLYMILKSETILNKFQQLAESRSGTFPQITFDSIKNLVIKLPSLEEQQNIVSILSSLDDKIELNNKMNETLEEMAQTIFKEWFVNFNFPNEEGKPYKDNGGKMVESELGMIPEGWRVYELKGLGEIVTGKTPNTKKKENYGGVYPFITIPDMHGKTFISETERSLSEEGNKVQAKKLLPINSVIVSCIATVGLVGINTRPSHTNQQINSIIPKKEFYLFYIYELIKNKKDLLYQLGSAGTTTLNVNKGIFEKIQVINPYEDILIQFYKAIKPIYDKVLENQSENQILIRTRDILLPKLMNGEIRV